MIDREAIRRRLDAVAGMFWEDVTWGSHEEEHYGHWAYVGPVMLMVDPDDPPEERRKDEAIVEFLQHVVEDMQALLGD